MGKSGMTFSLRGIGKHKDKFIEKSKDFFQNLFHLKPEDDRDYYRIGSFLFSKKLVFVVMAAVGILSLAYLFLIKTGDAGEDGSVYKTYRYNSPALKFLNGRAIILGKSGYRAYVGDVAHGMVKGQGILYDKEGNLVYEGEFDGNSYNGAGKCYYKGGGVCYQGEFADNLYQGKGRLYRENGTLRYEGEFERGYMEGEGVLYNASGDAAYTGHFFRDEVQYQELLGKTTEEGAGMYTGKRMVYETGEGYLVSMKDIDALYFGTEQENVSEGNFLISGLYVLKDKVWLGGEEVTEISQLTAYFGLPVYQGYTYLSEEDEIALNEAVLLYEDALFGPAMLELENMFDDVSVLNSFEKNYEVYIYVFEKEDVTYTFFSGDKNQSFSFYRMEQE